MTDNAAEPGLVLSYVDGIPDQIMRRFADAVSMPPVVVRLDRREAPGPIAALEWLLPTAAVLYIAKPYFEAFLKEAGKDHYQVLKRQLSQLWEVFFGDKRAVRTRVTTSTPAKVEQEPKYSRSFSLVAEGPEGFKLKLLMRDAAPPEELNRAVELFFELLAKYHRGMVEKEIAKTLASSPLGGLFLLAYDLDTGHLYFVDPREPG